MKGELTFPKSVAKVEAVGNATQMVRQWLVFPSHSLQGSNTARLHTFRLLIEMKSGHLLFVEIKSRASVTSEIVGSIAKSLGDVNHYGLQSTATPKLAELGFQPKLLECAFHVDEGWFTQALMAEAVLENFNAHSRQEGGKFSPRHLLEFSESIRLDFRKELIKFLAALQFPVVLTILETGNQLTAPAYNYFVGSNDEMVLRNRLQAIRAFPILLHGLSCGDGLGTIRLAIDGARKLVEAIAFAFGVPKSVTRLLVAQRVEVIGREWGTQIGVLLKFLASLPVRCRPCSGEDWSRFNATLQVIMDVSGFPLFSSYTRIWMLAISQRGAQSSDFYAIEREIQNAKAFQNTLISALAFVFRYKEHFKPSYAYSAVADLIEDIGVTRFSKLARSFDVDYARTRNDYKDLSEQLSRTDWRPVISETFKTELRTIQCLTTSKDLDDEGEAMDHCVASYTAFCFSGDAQIWSITGQDGQRCSTLHTTIALNPKGKMVVNVVQHQGRSNVEPSADCRSAVIALQHYLYSNQKLLADYLAWKQLVGSLTKDQRARVILMHPIVTSIKAILPKIWPLHRLESIVEGYFVHIR